MGSLFPLAPNKASHQKRQDINISHAFLILVAEANLLVSIAQCSGSPQLIQLLLVEKRFYFRTGRMCTPGTSFPLLHLADRAEVPCGEKQAGEYKLPNARFSDLEILQRGRHSTEEERTPKPQRN